MNSNRKYFMFSPSTWIAIGLVSLLVSPYVFTRPAIAEMFNFTQTGPIGDTIGGLTAPVINFITAILVYYAFKEQIYANNSLKRQNDFRLVFDLINSLVYDINNFSFDKHGKLFRGSEAIDELHGYYWQLGWSDFVRETKKSEALLIHFLLVKKKINEVLESQEREYFETRFLQLYHSYLDDPLKSARDGLVYKKTMYKNFQPTAELTLEIIFNKIDKAIAVIDDFQEQIHKKNDSA